ncbi:hypothetical protein F442_04908 [Phytophthora nicotianae P10297]|uniref:Uncharacterized protein n=2 Tax=Phytophthora nicotianae TaxID=4792 RepID=W2QG91_PHYN3|nr:hypothetical protein PPTG_22465 [Phytophthora nicotianae INRA-310]ETN12203.1 hypothetical protein PPTG_22465 [Phytophthora nicotianae INRA-310]ETP49588.1 hypothetical protein F442_04908 [Phytophthora nicotianae P10297]
MRVKAVLAPLVAVAPNERSEEGIAASTQMGANYARIQGREVLVNRNKRRRSEDEATGAGGRPRRAGLALSQE